MLLFNAINESVYLYSTWRRYRMKLLKLFVNKIEPISMYIRQLNQNIEFPLDWLMKRPDSNIQVYEVID